MNIRIASAFLLGLATMALASLSCSAEEPASTATPIPPASAQEVVESACTNMDKVDDYDFVTTIKVTENGRQPRDRHDLEGKCIRQGLPYHLRCPRQPQRRAYTRGRSGLQDDHREHPYVESLRQAIAGRR